MKNELVIPEQLNKEELFAMYEIVPKEESRQLISVHYYSDMDKRKNVEKILMVTDIKTGEENQSTVKLNDPRVEYGVHLIFANSECEGASDYIFVKKNNTWVLYELVEIFPSLECASEKQE